MRNNTHRVDQKAGGNKDDIDGMGLATVNRSIGRQWREKVVKLDEGVDKFLHTNNIDLKNAEKLKMNAKLTTK